MTTDLEFDQASYTVHFLTRREPPASIEGFGPASCLLTGGRIYASEWVMAADPPGHHPWLAGSPGDMT